MVEKFKRRWNRLSFLLKFAEILGYYCSGKSEIECSRNQTTTTTLIHFSLRGWGSEEEEKRERTRKKDREKETFNRTSGWKVFSTIILKARKNLKIRGWKAVKASRVHEFICTHTYIYIYIDYGLTKKLASFWLLRYDYDDYYYFYGHKSSLLLLFTRAIKPRQNGFNTDFS